MRRHRWERPFNVRPAQRSMSTRAKRARYTIDDVGNAFEAGHECGRIAERKLHEHRDEWLRRLADAVIDGTVEDLAREVGVMPPEDDGEQLVDELERWLREQD